MRGADGASGADGGGGGPVIVSTDATAIQGTPVSANAPVLGQILKFNGLELAYAPDEIGEDYTATIWVDSAGDAASDGLAPGKPTTLDAALTAATPGTLIQIAAGSYSPGVAVPDNVALVAMGAQSTPTALASVRFTTPLTLTGRNVRLVGIELDAVTDNSGALGAGTTVLEQCSVLGTVTVTNASGTGLTLISTSFANIAVASGTTAVIRLRSCPSGATITNASTGLVTTIAVDSNFTGLTQTAAGQQAIELRGCYLSGSVSRSAGSTTALILHHTVIVGSVDATGAGPGTVQILAAAFDRSGSTIPVGAESGAVLRSTEMEFIPATPSDWSPLPASVRSALDILRARQVAFSYIDDGARTTPLTTATLPGLSPYPGASTYLSVGSAGSPIVLAPGTYVFLAGYIVKVDANGTEFWIDTFVNGGPSSAGPSSEPIGKAGSQKNSTFTITANFPVTTPLWLDIKVAKGGGPGNVTFVAAYLILMRLF